MLPILITVIVPEAVSSKRVIPVTGSLPMVSSTEPVICSSGSVGVSPKMPPAWRFMPPDSAMKKTRCSVEPEPWF